MNTIEKIFVGCGLVALILFVIIVGFLTYDIGNQVIHGGLAHTCSAKGEK